MIMLLYLSQALSAARVQWSQKLRTLVESAVFSQLGMLVLAACYTSYLTPLPFNQVLSVTNTHVLPCIAEKGFVIHMQTKFSTKPFTEPSITSLSSPNGASCGTGDSTTNRPSPLSTSAHPPHPSSAPTEGNRFLFHSSEELTQCLLAVLSSDTIKAHHVFNNLNSFSQLHMAVVSRSWNKWPLVYDYEGIVGPYMKQTWGERFKDKKEREKHGIVVVDARDRFVCKHFKYKH